MPAKKTSTKKTSTKKAAPKQKQQNSAQYAVGRRKSSTARVYYYISPQLEIEVNGKDFNTAFPHALHKYIILQPLVLTDKQNGKWKIRVVGGGTRGQAEAIRLGISRVLVKVDEELRPVIKKSGFLTRDPRVKERKKYGLKRARRAPQWQKR